MSESLYGVKQASKTKVKEISSSTALAFSSNLASLISTTSSKPVSDRVKSSKKPDIFSTHNKNVKKRAAADMLEEGEQRHRTKHDIGSVDSEALQRSRRKLEEKSRLYDAMKKGDHSLGHGLSDDRGLVDFDRKWAERQAQGDRSDDSDDSEFDTPDDSGEIVEYVDEFGRRRKGTKAQAQREERRLRIQAVAEKEAEEFSARPTLPSNIIYGDAVQHEAFNPDQTIADRMAEIAKKRDKSATPPPETHFDANAEIRTKGTGFYAFSHDAEERKRQMTALEEERTATEKIRDDRAVKQQQRRLEIEERKKKIAQQRGQAQADKILKDLELELQ